MKKTNELKTVKRRRLRAVWELLKGSKHLYVIGILTAGLAALADMITPQLIRLSVDNVIGRQVPEAGSWQAKAAALTDNFGLLRRMPWILAAAVILVAVVRCYSQYLFRVYNTKASETFVKTMRDRVFSHIERLPFAWHMKNHTGDIIQRCTSDVDMVRNFISEQMTSIFRIVLMIVLSSVFMLQMNVALSLICFIPFPLLLWQSIRFHKGMQKGFLECDENEGKLSAMAQENLTGVRVVRAFGKERYEKDRFEAHNEHYTGLWTRMAKLMSRYWSMQDFIAAMQVLLVLVFGALFCVRGKLSAGEYIAFISYNATLSDPIRMLGRMISEMSKAGVSVDRICQILEAEEEKDADDAGEADMRGDICFDHVSFCYDPGVEILHDVSFTMKAGSTLGILGGTGSGKSTMMLLLDKLYALPEDCGSITIGGTDIRKIRTEYLRSNIAMVLQEPHLFSRSIAENIAVTNPGLTEEEIRAAARDACLDRTVQGFPKGYDTFVGERGVTLSGGQKQRTAIARALAQKTPILVFDDSLSAVDTRTDAAIRESLQAKFGTASIILISHRITTLSKADLILVLEDGKIAEMGTHEELVNKNGIYRRIFDIQSGAGEEAAE